MIAVFVSSDPGGAQEIAAIVRWLKGNHSQVECRPFTDASGYRAPDLVYSVVPAEPRAVGAVLDAEVPDVLLTGTSLKPSIEMLFLEEAIRRGTPCYAVIDHWTDFRMRFLLKPDRPTIPTQIFVNDQRAMARAVEEGLPLGRLRVFGNPHVDEAASFRPRKSRSEVLGSIGCNADRKLILFLSDALSEVTGSEEASRFRFGYSEVSILTEFLACLERLSSTGNFSAENYDIVVKLHPMENPRKFSSLRQSAQSRFAGRLGIVKDAPLWDLLFHADYVAGMFTAAILQASCMGKRPLRIELGVKCEDLLPIPEWAYYARVVDATHLDVTVKSWLHANSSTWRAPVLEKAYEKILPEILK